MPRRLLRLPTTIESRLPIDYYYYYYYPSAIATAATTCPDVLVLCMPSFRHLSWLLCKNSETTPPVAHRSSQGACSTSLVAWKGRVHFSRRTGLLPLGAARDWIVRCLGARTCGERLFLQPIGADAANLKSLRVMRRRWNPARAFSSRQRPVLAAKDASGAR